MEETAQVNNPQKVSQPIQPPVENPVQVKLEEKPKKNSGLSLILSFTTIIATLIAGFFYFQNMQLRSELQKNLPSLTPTPTATPDETADWNIYKSTKYGYSLKYPSSLFIADCNKENNIAGVYLDNKGVPPCDNPEPQYQIQLDVRTDKKTLDEYIKDWPDTFKINLMETTSNGFHKYSVTKVGDAPGTDNAIIFALPINKGIFYMFINDIEQEVLAEQIISTFTLNEETKVNCTSPRPEVCTEECIVNPPYVCGSDGKSYCTTCQACSNTNVEWYVTQDTACEVK